MSLSINKPEASVNPHELTKEEQEQWNTWEAMSDDEKGEHLFNVHQDLSNADYITREDETLHANNHVIQKSPTGVVRVGGALRADTLINANGIEMTVKQAVDLGIAGSEYVGQQTADLLTN